MVLCARRNQPTRYVSETTLTLRCEYYSLRPKHRDLFAASRKNAVVVHEDMVAYIGTACAGVGNTKRFP